MMGSRLCRPPRLDRKKLCFSRVRISRTLDTFLMSLDAGGQPTKILTIGPACGRIKELLSKVKAINDKHGPFQALFCLGDLFTPYDGKDAELSAEEASLLEGTAALPIPTYFFTSATPLHPLIEAIITEKHDEEGEDPLKIAPDLFYLGKAKVSKLPSGLRVAVAGGLWDISRFEEREGNVTGAAADVLNPIFTSTSLNRLLAHPSFCQVHQVAPPAEEEEDPPQSLAAARAQMAAKAQAVQQLVDDKVAQDSKPPVDLLLTTSWPTGITMFSNPEKLPHPTSRMWGAPSIAQLVRACQPRYHFSLAPGSCGLPNGDSAIPLGIAGLEETAEGSELREMGIFWEREPYKNEEAGSSHPLCSTTRFINLARLANAKKHRWFMALNLVPAANISKHDAQQAAKKAMIGATPSPFSAGGYGGSQNAFNGKRKADDIGLPDEMEGPNFRWSGNASRGKGARRGGAKGLPSRPEGPLPNGPREQKPLAIPVGPQDCWFCLSNPQCAKHLIVAIGTECYVAMPKGQLPPTSDPLSPVPGGGHVLIIPIEHFPSLLGHTDAELARPIAEEMQSWRNALRKAYASFHARLVSWEVCKTIGSRAGHMQSQVVPIPSTMFAGIEDYFREASQKWGYSFIEDQAEVQQMLQISDEDSTRRQRCDYVRLDFDNKTWFMLLTDRRFNLQFPRETIASYLGVADRADWKKCARSEGIETAEARAFKAAFEPFGKEVA